MKMTRLGATILLIGMASASIGGCASPTATEPTAAPATAAPPSVTATPTLTPLPTIGLEPGEYYFNVDGTPTLLYSRNVAGYQQLHYAAVLDLSKKGGSTIARIQLDSFDMGYTRDGGVDPNWLGQWDQVLSKAEADGIYVLPVFSGWFDWNAGQGYSKWGTNPLNQANGGPVKNPAELFEKDSNTQKMLLTWMESLVRHWEGRRNIIAWEIFSEVNLASGATEAKGIEFVNRAAEVIRAADTAHRPVTASIAETGTWPSFYRETAIDFINVHPYPPSAKLDREIMSKVRDYLTTYQRPVLIGESGLNADSPEKYPAKAEIGVRHAIWAATVSGAMNGRGLYWEDSFAIYFQQLGMPFLYKYETIERTAADFVSGVDFSGFRPVQARASSGIWGAVLGNEKSMIGWYRDAGSEPPEWPMQPVLSKQTVKITVPEASGDWQVDFYDTQTGSQLPGSATIAAAGSSLTIALPDFTDDIAFKLHMK